MSAPFAIDAAFEASGTPVETGANRPLLLDDPGGMWLVREGTVDVFSTRLEDGEPVGARAHVFRAGVGQALFGTGGARSSRGLVAVGTAGAPLLRLERSRVAALAAASGGERQPAEWIDAWARHLLSGVTRANVPKQSKQIAAGDSLTLEPGEIAVPADGVVWVRHLEGGSRFEGAEDAP